MKTETELGQEFDRLYSEGKVGVGILDDDLPDYRDKWIAEHSNLETPEYHFFCSIVDETSGETILKASTYISEVGPNGECESVDMEVGNLLRAFREKYNG